MSTQHTPGPWFTADWEVDDGPNQDVIEAREPEVLLPGQSSSSIWPGGVRCLQIANVRESSVDPETTVANARLIAAAPELLQAALDLVAMCKLMGLRIHPGSPADRARAAIAKATGDAS